MEPLLQVCEVTKQFGGLVANSDISFTVSPGQITAVIGPNGAGKTTLFNLITGIWSPTKGEIRFRGKAIHQLSPEGVASLGIGRTFQTPQTFGGLPVVENVMVGWARGKRPGLFGSLFSLPSTRAWDRTARANATAALQEVGLTAVAEARAGALSFGERRLMEVARALTLQPDLLLLDEPAAGLTRAEVRQLAAIMKRLRNKGVAIIFIEHDVSTVMEVADQIVVLNFGKKIAGGTPEEIRRNSQVRDAYLGSGEFSMRPPAEAGQTLGPTLLQVQDLATDRGSVRALSGVNMEVREGELVAVLGANGAGKTTLLGTLAGLYPPVGGRVVYGGQDITALKAEHAVFRGLSLVPEQRQVFTNLTVTDNLRLGAYNTLGFAGRRNRHQVQEQLDWVLELLPRLRERRNQLAGSLSGGEQQMLAIARSLMSRPRLLLLDEPSTGLAPRLVEEIFLVLHQLRTRGTTTVLVEQNARAALAVADRAYVLERGTIRAQGTPAELTRNADLDAAYLGQAKRAPVAG